MRETENIVVRCSKCGANNRIKPTSDKRRPVCGKCRTPLVEHSSLPITFTDANFADLVSATELPVVVDFWAAWCGPCRMIAPTIEALAKEFSDKAIVGKLNVDANKRTAAHFRVQSIPTLLILKNGQEVVRLVGLQSKEAILRNLQPFF
jgi:thioredoxin 2